MEKNVSFRLNGRPVKVTTDPGHSLLQVLRTDLGLTGTKYGCGEGLCGACSVLLDGKVVRSCQVAVGKAEGGELTTIEGLAAGGRLHPLQDAFVRHDALQCGFCTPGMILTALDLLTRNPEPTRDEIISGMDGNLCRCGAHSRIIQAVETAAREMKGGVRS